MHFTSPCFSKSNSIHRTTYFLSYSAVPRTPQHIFSHFDPMFGSHGGPTGQSAGERDSPIATVSAFRSQSLPKCLCRSMELARIFYKFRRQSPLESPQSHVLRVGVHGVTTSGLGVAAVFKNLGFFLPAPVFSPVCEFGRVTCNGSRY